MNEIDRAKAAKVTARAVVRLEIEISVSGTWGGECEIAQVHKQAMDGARHWVREQYEQNGLRVIGEPEIVRIISTSELRR